MPQEEKTMNVLVTGGAGYIGSHICVELIEAGHDVVVIDDFSNSKPEVLDNIKKITGKEVKFYEFNVLDEAKTEQVFIENKLDSRCKFRGLSVASRNRHHLVINADLKEGVREQTWYNEEPAIELCKLILPAVEHSMAMLREGTYNKMVEEHLPYQHRTGVIPRKVEWKYYPSAKENVFEGLSDSAFGHL